MALVIYTLVGKTSNGKCPLGKYTRIGSAENSNLILEEDGVPEDVCIVEKTSQNTIKLHCKSSNALRLNKGKMLGKGDVVEWKQGETLDVCGGTVKLRLSDEEEIRPPKQEVEETSFRRSRRETIPQNTIPTRNVSRTISLDGALDDEEEKKKKSKKTTQMSVVVLCALIALLTSFSGGDKEAPAVNMKNAVYYILNDKVAEGGRSADFESIATRQTATGPETRFSFGREDLARQYQTAYLQKDVAPSTALVGYQTLQDQLTLAYRDERAKKVPAGKYYEELNDEDRANVDREIAPMTASYNEARAYIQGRIDALRAKLSED